MEAFAERIKHYEDSELLNLREKLYEAVKHSYGDHETRVTVSTRMAEVDAEMDRRQM